MRAVHSASPEGWFKQQRSPELVLLKIFLNLSLFLFFGVFTFFLGYAAHKRFRKIYMLTPLIIVSLVWFVGFGANLQLTPITLNSVIKFWLWTLPFAPILSISIRGVGALTDFLEVDTVSDWLKRFRKKEIKQRLSAYDSADRIPLPNPEAGMIRLGTVLTADYGLERFGIDLSDGFLTASEKTLSQHIFILGTTGSGKTETIKRLVNEFLENTDRDIFFVDGKGDLDLAEDIRAMCFKNGRGDTPIFKLGFSQKGAIYDAFQASTPSALVDRLFALTGLDEAEGNAQYYADVSKKMLQMICLAPSGPPANLQQLVERLNPDWMTEAWRGTPYAPDIIRIKKMKTEMTGLWVRLSTLAMSFEGIIHEDGFTLESVKSAIFSIRTQSQADTSERFMRFLLADINDYVGERKTNNAVLIIDEFGQFGSKNIIPLLMMARSQGFIIVLSTQTLVSLGSEEEIENIWDNTGVDILMSTKNPERMAESAGTHMQAEPSVQYGEEGPTGMGSFRFQHTFKVNPNDVAELLPGEAFIIRKRNTARIKIRAIGKVEHLSPRTLPEPEQQTLVEAEETAVTEQPIPEEPSILDNPKFKV